MPGLFSNDDGSRGWAIASGLTVAAGVVAGNVLNRVRQNTLPLPQLTPPAFEAEVETLDLIEGSSRYYWRPGEGKPLLLLHSINAAASSFEMKPLFDHFARTTGRPLFALDWLGFGLSDRPDISYRPALFERQLRRFLSERCAEAPDVVALSLAAEYAVSVAATSPFLISRMALISPVGLEEKPPTTQLRRWGISLTDRLGAFDTLFYRMTEPKRLRQFYESEIFSRAEAVPDELVSYGHATAHVRGGHYAPRYFLGGSLFLNSEPHRLYEKLTTPTLLAVPESPPSSLHRFDHLEALLEKNAQHVSLERLPGGFMPHWEAPEACFDALDAFLTA